MRHLKTYMANVYNNKISLNEMLTREDLFIYDNTRIGYVPTLCESDPNYIKRVSTYTYNGSPLQTSFTYLTPNGILIPSTEYYIPRRNDGYLLALQSSTRGRTPSSIEWLYLVDVNDVNVYVEEMLWAKSEGEIVKSQLILFDSVEIEFWNKRKQWDPMLMNMGSKLDNIMATLI